MTRSADVRAATAAFPSIGEVRAVRVWPGGHIHESFRVHAAGGTFLLQRCNTDVIADLGPAMANAAEVVAVCSLAVAPLASVGGGCLWRGAGGTWRAFPFVRGTSPGAPVRTPARARALAVGLGRLHRDVVSVDPSRLHVTIPGFHDVAGRIAALETAVTADVSGRLAGASAELDALRELAGELGAAAESWSAAPLRVAHLDAKAENFLVDRRREEVRAIVDLDTVMPASWLWDVGDLVRSSTGAEREDDERARFSVERHGAIVAGYLASVGEMLDDVERDGLAWAGPVVTFEQAARFLTDHLQGDRYYRVEQAGHNLARCRGQLALLRSMREERSAMIWPG